MKIWYRCIDHCEESFYWFETAMVDPVKNDCLELVAEEAAENYHDHHDGFASSWPLTFSLHETEDGPELCRYIVELEMSPTFNAALVEGDDNDHEQWMTERTESGEFDSQESGERE